MQYDQIKFLKKLQLLEYSIATKFLFWKIDAVKNQMKPNKVIESQGARGLRANIRCQEKQSKNYYFGNTT